ncbi:MAG: hypothetical protein KGK08_14885, partial [Acidobacteriota bacterium]|nr:hypothetical protein [Acidobacteriota bacterium]
GGKHMFHTTHAFALLGGAGVTQVLQTTLQQTVRSPDGRFEYTLALNSLPYATGARIFNVPKADDGLVMLGVRRVWSAQRSCPKLGFANDRAHPALLKGECLSHGTPPSRDATALDLELCMPNTDISNVDGRLQCASRFSGPFEQQFQKYDGNLRGSYVYTHHVLQVYSNDEPPRQLAMLQNPEMCRPGSISFTARTHLKAHYSLSCQHQ